MRIIRNFDDVQQVLRELETGLNEFKARTWDLNQRRITNVHPSQNEYDVVVRKELFGPVEELAIEKKAAGGYYDVCIFGAGINTAIQTGYLGPQYISAFRGSFVKCYAVATEAPTGQAIIFDIERVRSGVGTSIFSTLPTIPVSDTTVQITSAFAIGTLVEGDLLRCNITQIGSTSSGSNLVIKLKIRRS